MVARIYLFCLEWNGFLLVPIGESNQHYFLNSFIWKRKTGSLNQHLEGCLFLSSFSWSWIGLECIFLKREVFLSLLYWKNGYLLWFFSILFVYFSLKYWLHFFSVRLCCQFKVSQPGVKVLQGRWYCWILKKREFKYCILYKLIFDVGRKYKTIK